MKLELDANEVQFIMNVLGQLPTSSNAYVLWKKIEEQAQVPKEANNIQVTE